MYPEYLMHYGVKGMRWGVRKTEKKFAKLNKSSLKKEETAMQSL